MKINPLPFQDVIEEHVSKLQESVGLLSGVISQEISDGRLQEIAENSARPKEFVEKYKNSQSQVRREIQARTIRENQF